jgi:hypothetical protein
MSEPMSTGAKTAIVTSMIGGLAVVVAAIITVLPEILPDPANCADLTVPFEADER